jgi:hypothetical protein
VARAAPPMDGVYDDAEPNIHNEGQEQADASEIWNDDALLQAYESAVSGFKSQADSAERPTRGRRCASATMAAALSSPAASLRCIDPVAPLLSSALPLSPLAARAATAAHCAVCYWRRQVAGLGAALT